jgi:hypothetical protein
MAPHWSGLRLGRIAAAQQHLQLLRLQNHCAAGATWPPARCDSIQLYCLAVAESGLPVSNFIVEFPTLLSSCQLHYPATNMGDRPMGYSTVTDLARLRGLSTSQPRATAMW